MSLDEIFMKCVNWEWSRSASGDGVGAGLTLLGGGLLSECLTFSYLKKIKLVSSVSLISKYSKPTETLQHCLNLSSF